MREITSEYRQRLREKLMGSSFELLQRRSVVEQSVGQRLVEQGPTAKRRPFQYWNGSSKAPTRETVSPNPEAYKWNSRANSNVVLYEEDDSRKAIKLFQGSKQAELTEQSETNQPVLNEGRKLVKPHHKVL